jgi:hypothetical protein
MGGRTWLQARDGREMCWGEHDRDNMENRERKKAHVHDDCIDNGFMGVPARTKTRIEKKSFQVFSHEWLLS